MHSEGTGFQVLWCSISSRINWNCFRTLGCWCNVVVVSTYNYITYNKIDNLPLAKERNPICFFRCPCYRFCNRSTQVYLGEFAIAEKPFFRVYYYRRLAVRYTVLVNDRGTGITSGFLRLNKPHRRSNVDPMPGTTYLRSSVVTSR